MSFQDKTLECSDCGAAFTFSADEPTNCSAVVQMGRIAIAIALRAKMCVNTNSFIR